MDAQKKRDMVKQLLDHWQDFFEEATSGAVVVREDPNKPMSKDWTILSSMSRHPSVVELARCLEKLQRFQPSHFKHLRAFYAAPKRTVEKPTKIRAANGKMVDAQVRVSERVLPSWILVRMVDLALVGVLWYWDDSVVLELPKALRLKLREAINPETGEPAWTEAA